MPSDILTACAHHHSLLFASITPLSRFIHVDAGKKNTKGNSNKLVKPKVSPDAKAAASPTPSTFASIEQVIAHKGQGSNDPPRPVCLPKKGEKNILITSALPYVNNVPHLGNIIGCVLSGDVYARFCRLRDYNSIYICGTDEYGTATETKAQQEGLTPQQICDKYNVIHRQVYDWFDISFDYFGRTSTDKQTEIAQDIFHHCNKNGFVQQGSLDQLYCTQCTRFLADRFVTGICPSASCAYTDARGDQCDQCGSLINAIELINPKCASCGTTPEPRTSNHLFLDLPAVETKLREYVESKKSAWSDNAYTITKSWFDKGLRQRCITRDLRWGTKVPLKGYEDKVFYVWFDAPIGYISITANYTDEWEKWWKNPEDVELVQFMGKDNVPFHTVIFPSTLLAANDNYTMMSTLPTTEYLNYEGGKFSKSRGTGVFGNTAMETGIPCEMWRYYLLFNRPESSDTVFMWDDFASKINTDLNNNLGNLVQRILAFTASKLGATVPAYEGGAAAFEQNQLDVEIEKEVSALLAKHLAHMEKREIKDALRTAMDISFAGNAYMQKVKAWELLTADIAACRRAIYVLLQIIRLLSVILEPFMPAFSRAVRAQLQIQSSTTALKDVTAWGLKASLEGQSESKSSSSTSSSSTSSSSSSSSVECGLWLPAGHVITSTPSPVFRKVEPTLIESLRKRFSGQPQQPQAEEQKKSGGKAGGKAGDEQKNGFPLDLVVGQIKSVDKHPTNPKVYVCQVDFGEPEPRQIASGLAGTYPNADQLVNTNVVAILNLKPAKIGGVPSNGMIITGIDVTDAGTNPYVITCAAKPGTKVVPEGAAATPAKNFDLKAKLPGLMLTVGAGGVALAGLVPLKGVDGSDVVCKEAPEGSRIG